MTPTKVVPADTAAEMATMEPEPEEAPSDLKDAAVGPSSPLALLKGKRAELEATLFLDLEVPRWAAILGRALWVRYSPASLPYFETRQGQRKENHEKAVRAGKHGDPDWLIKANADLLVASCVAVYDLAVGEQPPTGPLPEELPNFGTYGLSEALDTPEAPCPRNAVGTCLHVYGTPSDLLMASQQLLVWSGELSREADRSFLTD